MLNLMVGTKLGKEQSQLFHAWGRGGVMQLCNRKVYCLIQAFVSSC